MKLAGWILLALGFLGFVLAAVVLTITFKIAMRAGPPSASPAAIAHSFAVAIRCAWVSVGLQLLGGLCLLLGRIIQPRKPAGFPVLPG